MIAQVGDVAGTGLARRVRPGRDPTRPGDPIQRLARLRKRPGHVGFAPRAKVLGEDQLMRGNLSSPDEELGHVLASERGVRERGRDLLGVHAQTELPEAVENLVESLSASKSSGGESGEQVRVLVVEEVAQEVDLPTEELGGEFNTRDQLDSQPVRFRPRDSQGGNRVVIGDRQGGESLLSSGSHNLPGRASAVGVSGVQMKVGTIASRR